MALSSRVLAAFTASVVGTVQCGDPKKHLRAIQEHMPDAGDPFPEAEFHSRMHRVDGAGGQSSMIESETGWERRENVSVSPFMSVSKEQFQALSNHHRASFRLANATSFLQASQVGNHTSFADDSIDAFETEHTDAISQLKRVSSQLLANVELGMELKGTCGTNANVFTVPYHSRSDVQENSSLVESDSCYATSQAWTWMVFDTGSTNIWVEETHCEGCTNTKYDKEKSLTYLRLLEDELRVNFATAEVAGQPSQDAVHVGGILVNGQVINVIDKEEGSVFGDVGLQGIAGLAFPRMAAHGHTPLLDSMVKQGRLKHPMFSFYLSRTNPASNVMSWGGAPDEKLKIDPYIHVPIVEPWYWKMGLYRLDIGGDPILPVHDDGAAAAALVEQGQDLGLLATDAARTRASAQAEHFAIWDSGTTLFSAPGTFLKKILAKLPPAACSTVTDFTHPLLTFTLRDIDGVFRQLSFSNKDYMQRSGDQCAAAFMEVTVPAEHAGKGAFILGMQAMYKYLTVYFRDPENNEKGAKVCIAPANQGPEAELAVHKLLNQKQFLAEAAAAA